MASFIIIFFYSTTSKLIASNTIQVLNNTEIKDQQVNLTIWMQFRHSLFQLYPEDREVILFTIVDQTFEIQVLIFLHSTEDGFLDLNFVLSNSEFNKTFVSLKKEWHKVSIQRDICFNKIQCEDISMSQNCSESFDAQMQIFDSQFAHIYIYDNEELMNEEIILRNLLFQRSHFAIITKQEELVLKIYSKFFLSIERHKLFQLQAQEYLVIRFDRVSNFILITNYRMYDQSKETLQTITVEFDQWILFGFEFNQNEILMYQYVNNNINQFKILESNPLNMVAHFYLHNNEAFVIDSLQIISQINGKFYDSCISFCYFCLFGQCQDQIMNKSVDSIINSQIRDSISSNRSYLQNNQCGDDILYLKDGQCYELPKYRDEYCIKCNITRTTIRTFNQIIKYNDFLDVSYPIIYQYYYLNPGQKYQNQKQLNNGLIFESDLNIFVMKQKDLYLTYLTTDQGYCEYGYSYFHKCRKNSKKVMLLVYDEIICSQGYQLINNKCMKCQLHCLYCYLKKKTIKCIITNDDYFLNDKKIIQKCTRDSQIFNCLTQKGAFNYIENLESSQRQACQQNQIFILKQFICVDFNIFEQGFNFLEHFPQEIKLQEQKLEIQNLIFVYQKRFNQQIRIHINIQQLMKLSILISYFQQKQRMLISNYISHLLMENDQISVDVEIKKITLKDIKIYLFNEPIIIFQNQQFNDLIDVYKEFFYEYEIFQIIQFDLIFEISLPRSQILYSFIIDYENFTNCKFIFNISFKASPSLFVRNGNRFLFKCNQIILNGLVFDYTFDYYEKIPIVEQPIFQIYSLDIVISNLIFYKQKLQNIFCIKNFFTLNVLNLYIENSSLKLFLYGDYQESNYQKSKVNIYEVYVARSQLDQFLQIEASTININNLYYFDVEIRQFHFYLMNGQRSQFNNFYLSDVDFNQSGLIRLEKNLTNNISTCVLFKIYLKDSFSNKGSILFQMKGFQYLQFKNLFLNVYMQQSYIMIIEDVNHFYLKDLSVKDSSMQHFRFLIFIVSKFSIVLSNIYINQLSSDQSNLISIGAEKIDCNYFIFVNCFFQQGNLLDFKAEEIYFNHLVFSQFQISQCRFLVQLATLKLLSIQNVKFAYYEVNNSDLINFQSLIDIQIINFSIDVVQIYNFDKEQLLLIEAGNRTNTLSQLAIQNVKVTSKVANYYLIRMKNQFKMVINHTLLQNVENMNSQSQVIVFDNQLFSLELIFLNIIEFFWCNLLTSQSNILIISNSKIEQSIQLSSSFILFPLSRNTEILFWIFDLRLMHFSGNLLKVDNQNVIAKFQNFVFSYLYNFRMFTSFGFSQESQIWINNLIIINLYPSGTLIYGFFQRLHINNVYMDNIDLNMIYLFYYREVIMSNIYVVKQTSKQQFLKLSSELINQRLEIYNFTIKGSMIEQNTFLEFVQLKGKLILENFKIVDSSFQKQIFDIQSNDLSSIISINNIILQNLESQECLFMANVSLNYQWIVLLGGFHVQIFCELPTKNTYSIKFTQGLIADFGEPCFLGINQLITLNQSEVINSIIDTNSNQLTLVNSQYLGRFDDNRSPIQMYFSLNKGKELFKYQSISHNVYQVQFSKNNTYLYLPSGRTLYNYKYFNYATGMYEKLYESLSLVNLNGLQYMKCMVRQILNDKKLDDEDFQFLLEPGINEFRNISFILNPLLKDQHIKFDVICNQSDRFITYRLLVKTLNCQMGEILYNDQCSYCNLDLKLYSVGYNQQYCLLMDETTMEQLDIGQIKLFKQYWRYSYANKYVEQCKQESCLGGWEPGDKSCQIGYVGALCQECDVYNIRGYGSFGRTNSQCSQCYFGFQIYIKGLMLLLIQIGLVYITYYQNQQLSTQYLLQKISKRNFIEILLRQNVNQVSIMLKLFYNYLFTIYLLKDINNFGYIIDLSLNVISNPSFIAVPQFDCIITQIVQYPIQYTQLLLKILVPISLINLIVITYIILIKLKFAKYGIYAIILILVVTYQQNQQVILQRQYYTYINSLIKLISKVEYSNIYWTLENLNVQYFSKSHRLYLFRLVIPLIILFVLINIMIYFWIRKVNKRTFNNLKYSIFILKQYKYQFYFWDYVRQIYLWLFMLVLYTYDVNLIILLNVIFIIITHINQPFQLKNCNQIDQIVHQFCLITYFAIINYQNNDEIKKIIIIIFTNIIFIIIYLKYLVHTLDVQYRQQKIYYLRKLIQLFPYFNKYLSIEIYTKNKYYYSILKQGMKKSNNTSITGIGRSAESKQNLYMSFEVEMSQISQMNIKS